MVALIQAQADNQAYSNPDTTAQAEAATCGNEISMQYIGTICQFPKRTTTEKRQISQSSKWISFGEHPADGDW